MTILSFYDDRVGKFDVTFPSFIKIMNDRSEHLLP